MVHAAGDHGLLAIAGSQPSSNAGTHGSASTSYRSTVSLLLSQTQTANQDVIVNELKKLNNGIVQSNNKLDHLQNLQYLIVAAIIASTIAQYYKK